MVNSPQPAEETNEQSMKSSMKKKKEIGYIKALQKNGMGPSTLFCFDVLTQFTNILARITLYELLRLFKFTRDALRKALADVEVFVTQILAICEEKDGNHCHHTRSNFPASPSPQKTCKLKENMIDPCII